LKGKFRKMMQTIEMAYAKINLCLDVTARRENGYHEIDGVMQSVTLCDEVTVKFEPKEKTEIVLTAEGNSAMPTDHRNLAFRAAEKLLECMEVCGEVQIHLKKRIPMAGGLAGGSTDAAAVLRGLNRLLPQPCGIEKLCEIGGRLGADVPFCVVGGAMRTQGIGDVLSPVPSMPDCFIVIARRGEGVSTPWAYGKLDEIYENFRVGADRPDSGLPVLLGGLETGSMEKICSSVYNIFEPVVSQLQGDVNLLRETMLREGALVSRMSGSGPSVFGVFAQERSAEQACRELLEMGAEAFVCRPFSQNFS
jgi:4-diphosphocytidyl-2-C-methyl-D-erythritol kinase